MRYQIEGLADFREKAKGRLVDCGLDQQTMTYPAPYWHALDMAVRPVGTYRLGSNHAGGWFLRAANSRGRKLRRFVKRLRVEIRKLGAENAKTMYRLTKERVK